MSTRAAIVKLLNLSEVGIQLTDTSLKSLLLFTEVMSIYKNGNKNTYTAPMSSAYKNT